MQFFPLGSPPRFAGFSLNWNLPTTWSAYRLHCGFFLHMSCRLLSRWWGLFWSPACRSSFYHSSFRDIASVEFRISGFCDLSFFTAPCPLPIPNKDRGGDPLSLGQSGKVRPTGYHSSSWHSFWGHLSYIEPPHLEKVMSQVRMKEVYYKLLKIKKEGDLPKVVGCIL